MWSSTGVRHERQEVSSTDSPGVESSIPVRGKFFAEFFSALIQFWQIWQNDLFTEKLVFVVEHDLNILKMHLYNYRIRLSVFVISARRCFWDGHYQSEKKAHDPLYSFLYLMMNCKHIRKNSMTCFQSSTIKLIKYCVRGIMGCVLTLCWFQWQNFNNIYNSIYWSHGKSILEFWII